MKTGRGFVWVMVWLCMAAASGTESFSQDTPLETKTLASPDLSHVTIISYQADRRIETTYCNNPTNTSVSVAEGLSSKSILSAEVSSLFEHTNYQYATSFESSEAYTLGSISGQNGWTMISPAADGAAQIVDVDSGTGTFALLITNKNSYLEKTVILRRTLSLHLLDGTHYSFDCYWAPRTGSLKSSLGWKIIMTDDYFYNGYAALSSTNREVGFRFPTWSKTKSGSGAITANYMRWTQLHGEAMFAEEVTPNTYVSWYTNAMANETGSYEDGAGPYDSQSFKTSVYFQIEATLQPSSTIMLDDLSFQYITAPDNTNRPATPSGLTCSLASTSSLTMVWQDNADNETHYIIERKVENQSAWVQAAILVADATNYTDEPLTPGTLYFYRVAASNDYNISQYSDASHHRTLYETAPAATRYVSAGNPAAAAPYTNWGIAATTIQDAINISAEGDTIWVSNGIYESGAKYGYPDGAVVGTRVAIIKPVHVRSVNGPASTVIKGESQIRCAYLTNGAVLEGFTVRDANVSGGQQWLDSTGGGIWSESGGIAIGCLVSNCSATASAGGMYQGTFSQGVFVANHAGGWGGAAMGCMINNSLLVNNNAGGWGGGASQATLNNCTIVNNAVTGGGGAAGGGVFYSTLRNCILVGNTTATIDPNYQGGDFQYTCTTPLPGVGTGNITNLPQFVNAAGENFRLLATSPCRETGSNAYAPGSADLDGNPRIMNVTVDMGAYEFVFKDQTITFQPIGDQLTTNTVGLSATASSGLPVAFAVGSGPGSISSGTNLSFTGAGSVSIVASQNGDTNWAAAPPVTNTFTVEKSPGQIFLLGLSQPYDGTARTVTATTMPAGLTVEITYDGSVAAPTNVGTYAVTGTINSVMYQGWTNDALVVTNQLPLGTATLPTSYSGPWQLGTPPAGWFFYGLGVDSLPGYDGLENGAARFDNTGDQIAIHYNGSANFLTYWVMGMTFSGGTFQVENSTDGLSWSPLKIYTQLTSTATFESISPPTGARYIRFIYNNKVVGNVGIDGISLSESEVVITKQPESRTNYVGSTASFTVEATGTLPRYYQWQKNTTNISLATNATYSIAAVTIADAGGYGCRVSTPGYAVTSEVAQLTVLKAEQTITFPPIGDQLTTNNIGLHATASSGLSVTFAVGSGPATISGGTNLTFIGNGSVSIVASQTGNDNWEAAPSVTNTFNVTKALGQVYLLGLSQPYNGAARAVTATTMPAGLTVEITYNGSTTVPTDVGNYAVTGRINSVMYQGFSAGLLQVVKGNQAITFPPIGDKLLNDEVGLSASANSGLPVTFAVGSGPAIISDETNLTFTATGHVSIVASQVGDNNWNPAPSLTNAFNVTKAPAQIFLMGLSQSYDGSPRTVTATTMPAGLTVEITYDGLTFPPINSGDYAVTGTVVNAIYSGLATGRLVVAKGEQTITFLPIGDKQTTEVVGLSASASSGLPVTFVIGNGPAVLSDGTNLTFTGTGRVSIVASQGGNSNWSAAPSVTNSFNVRKVQAQVFLLDLFQIYNGTARTVTATTMPAGLTVSITYNGQAWAPTNAGEYAVTGTIIDAIYAGAATGTLSISKADQTITFPPIPNQCSTNKVSLVATASSGLVVSFGTISGPGVISNGTNLTFTTWGIVLVTASQAGNQNWNAAPSLTNAVIVTNTPPVVCVATQQVFLANLGDMAVLDATCSSDIDREQLFFSWREYYQNPRMGLIPIGAEGLGRLRVYFPAPGRYQYEVRVSDGQLSSVESRVFTVYVPGLKGVVELSSSDGSVMVPDSLVEVYATSTDAANKTNRVDVAVADSLGRYVLECIGPASTTLAKDYYLQVSRPSFVTSEVTQVTVRPDPGFADDEYNLRLNRDMLGALSGKVLNTNEMPVSDVTVSILGVGGTPRVTTTSGAGTFTLEDIPYGTWILQLQKGGYQAEARDICVSPGMGSVVVHLSSDLGLCSLTGLVTLVGTDQAIGGVTVSLGSQKTTTGNNGSYSFQDVSAGSYVLTAAKSGYNTERYLVVKLDAGVNQLDIPMSFAKKGATVFGVVVDDTDASPVRWATIGVENAAGLLIRSAVSDHTGHFQLLDVPVGGNQVLRIGAPGYRSQRISFAVSDYYSVTARLERAANWQEPSGPNLAAPVADVVTNFIALGNMQGSVTLDGTPSTGTSLRYIWRENPDNPVLNLVPAGSEAMKSFVIGGFSKPGIYRYELQVKSGSWLSANTEVITVFVPGLAGNVHASPSDGVYGLEGATIRAYTNYLDAKAWNDKYTDSKLSENNPAGDFALTSLPTGSFWIVSRSTGYNQFGPERKQVNGSSGAQQLPVNLSRAEYALYGRITDTNGVGLENVRVVLTTGVRTETFRTTTGTNGDYRLYNVPRGSRPMMLVKDGYKAKTVNVTVSGDTEWGSSMERNESGQLANLSGVIDANYQGIALPVPYAEITLGGGMMRAFTDENGRYEFRDLPPGYYYGIIRKDGYRSKDIADSGFLYLAEGSNTQNRTLQFAQIGPVIRGVVVDENQQPVEGATLTILQPPGMSRRASARAMKLSATGNDAGGIFQLMGIPEGEHSFRVDLPGGTSFTTTVYVAGTMELIVEKQTPDTAFDQWMLDFPTVSGTNAAPDGDPDRDGKNNWDEFVANTCPTNPASIFSVQPISPSGGSYHFTLLTATGRLYDVYGRTNLIDGNWELIESNVPGTGGEREFSVPAYYRQIYVRPTVKLP